MMTRKDYVKIAKLLAETKGDQDSVSAWESMLYGLADIMQADNARFDRARFLNAASQRS